MDLVALAAIAGGADAVAMAKAARAADWRALGWKAEKLETNQISDKIFGGYI